MINSCNATPEVFTVKLPFVGSLDSNKDENLKLRFSNT